MLMLNSEDLVANKNPESIVTISDFKHEVLKKIIEANHVCYTSPAGNIIVIKNRY